MKYYLKQDKDFLPYLKDKASWGKSTDATRGFTDDEDAAGLRAEDKAAHLDDMLNLIAQYAPPLLSNDIVNQSTSLDTVWQTIRKYFGMKQSETQFMKLGNLKWESEERPEKLYHKVLAHIQDNLLSTESPLTHDGKKCTTDEVLTPTLERWAVLLWMQLIHPGLPALVQGTFACDLQRMTLKDLQPQICDGIDSFLEELNEGEVKAARTKVFQPRKPQYTSHRPQHKYNASRNSVQAQRPKKECRLCKAEGRRYIGHMINECDYLSTGEKRDMIKTCKADVDSVYSEDELAEDFEENCNTKMA